MPLSKKQVEKIVKDKTYFEAGILVDTGEVVWLNGKYVTEDKDGNIIESSEIFPDDKVLFVNYNENVDKRIREVLPRVLNQRGITNPDDIDLNHTQVQAKLREIKKMPGRNRKVSNEEENNAVVEMVRKAHQPQFMLSLMQVVLWSMLKDDLFKLSKEKAGINLNVKFDFEIPEEYWEKDIRAKTEDEELLYALITDAWKVDFKPYDRTNPLEMMLAYSTVIIDVYPLIADNIGALQSNVIVAFSYGGGNADFDDAMFLNNELDSVLRKPMVRRYDSVKWSNTDVRVPKEHGTILDEQAG